MVVSKFKPYTGKSATGPSMNGATYDLVMNLMRDFFEKGYNLYCDNYYTSPQLFWDLFQLSVKLKELSAQTTVVYHKKSKQSL